MAKLCLFCPNPNYIIKFRRNKSSPRKMSVQSLPQLTASGSTQSLVVLPIVPPVRRRSKGSGGGGSISSVDKSKYNSLPTSAKKASVLVRQPSKFDEVLQKRQRLNRNGSIGTLNFRGIKKEFLEKQTSMIAHSMTVGGGVVLFSPTHNLISLLVYTLIIIFVR